MRSKIKIVVKRCFDLTTPLCKTLLLFLTILYLPIIFKITMSSFNTTDTLPQIKAINTEVLKTIGPFTVRVKAGMFIKNFPVFDIVKNTFLIDAVVWFEFHGDEIMLETIGKFSIDNGKITYLSPPDIRILDDHIFAKYNVLFELKTDLNFHKFPFEDHQLPILLSNDFVTPEEMIFTVDASSFQTRPNIAPSGWKLNDMNIDAGILQLQLDRQDANKKAENPKALFVMKFMHDSARKALVIFVPLFSATFLSLLSFIINIGNPVGKFSLAITSLTALLGYRFVIEQMLPPVGYLTTTDAIYLFLLIFIFLIFSFQLLLTRYYSLATTEKKIDPILIIEKFEKFSGLIFLVLTCIFIAAITYLIFLF